MKIRARRKEVFSGNGINFWGYEKGEQGLWVAEPIMLREQREQDLAFPTFDLDPTEAQSLMDQLWDCGLRPSEGSGSAGALAATQKHLEDMRRLVFEPRKEPAR